MACCSARPGAGRLPLQVAAPAPHDAAQLELQALKMSALKQRATEGGADRQAIDGIDDSDDPRQAAISLIVTLESARESPSGCPIRMGCMNELEGLGLMALRERAMAEGVAPDMLDVALDSDRPKAAVASMVAEKMADRINSVAEGDSRRATDQLAAELKPLKLMALHAKAMAGGVAAGRVEEAMDGDAPRADLVALIVAHHQATGGGGGGGEVIGAAKSAHAGREEALRAELSSLRFGELQRRALGGGVPDPALEDALDGENARQDIVALILATVPPLAAHDDRSATHSKELEELRLELTGLRFGELQRRAVAAEGAVDPVALDDALDDEDDPKGRIVQLLLAARAKQQQQQQKRQRQDMDKRAQEEAALRAELSSLRFGELQRRALAGGVPDPALEDALDGENARQDIVALILKTRLAPPLEQRPPPEQRRQQPKEQRQQQEQEPKKKPPRGGESAAVASARQELAGKKVSELTKLARSVGVEEQRLDEAVDSEVPVAPLLIDLIVAAKQAAATASAAVEDVLRVELRQLKLSVLMKRARESGRFTEHRLEQVEDSDSPKEAAIELLVKVSNGDGRAAAAAAAAVAASTIAAPARPSLPESNEPPPRPATRREHSRTRSVTDNTQPNRAGAPAVVQTAKKAEPRAILPSGKHVMLSYAWGSQESNYANQQRVLKVQEAMARQGVRCFLDVDGGMQTDIFDSMAQGVEGACCVVCFMCQAYQLSSNCQLELKFSKQAGLPIVPVMMEDDPQWKASGWLGLLTAGLLWTNLQSDDVEGSVDRIVKQIKMVVPETDRPPSMAAVDLESAPEPEAPSEERTEELTQELKRLHDDLTAAVRTKPPPKPGQQTFDPDALAVVPGPVPKLPKDFRETDAIRELRRLLTAHDNTIHRVGFYGMGGIGKTVASTAIMRDEVVRRHFDQCVYVMLGQTPVMDKVRNFCYIQLTGIEMKVDWTEEEKAEQLRKAMVGKTLLLYLDDLWSPEHADMLDFIDPSTDSRVLISTRIKSLCGTHAVEIRKPTLDESVAILLAAAKMKAGSAVPSDAAEIVRLCGSLPLALSMAGKLICELGLGEQWAGVSEILRDELRDSFNTSTVEANVIRASLALLSGSERENQQVRNVFSLFALVPEDTFLPLDSLALMFDALFPSVSSRKVSILHLRKWLRVLIDRSLVLGSIDKPQLHDLVLDFAIGQFTPLELRNVHKKVVNAFREHRTVSMAGIKAWSPLNRGDAGTAYVLNEVMHHVSSAYAEEDGDEMMLEWVSDLPVDAIGLAAARILTADRLLEVVKRAVKAGDDYGQAVLMSMAGVLKRETNELSVVSQLHGDSVRACIRLRKAPSQSATNLPPKKSLDALELKGLKLFAFAGGLWTLPDLYEEIKKGSVPYLIGAIKAEDDPFGVYYLLGLDMGVAELFMSGDLEAISSCQLINLPALRASGSSAIDPQSRVEVLITMGAIGVFWGDILVMSPEFSWKSGILTLADMQMATECYDYGTHHVLFKEVLGSFDFGAMGANASLTAGHFGRFDIAQQSISAYCEIAGHLAAEPNQTAISSEKMFGLAGLNPLWCYILGRSADITLAMNEFGLSWSTAEAYTDEQTRAMGGMVRARGDTAKSDTAFVDATCAMWISKATCAYSTGCHNVGRDEILESLPTAEEFKQCGLVGPKGALAYTFLSPFPAIALMCEMVGAHDEALAFASIGMEHEHDLRSMIVLGGDPKPTSRILMHATRGRVLALQGKVAEAEQALEAAAAVCEKAEYWVLQALVLRDLVASVYGSNTRFVREKERCKRRLATAIDNLGGPSQGLGDAMSSAFVFDSNLTAVRAAGLDAMAYP